MLIPLRRLSLLAALVASAIGANACAVAPNEDPSASTSAAILGGASDAGHPAVGLVAMTNNGNDFWCSGTLVSPDVVLTAGHCLLAAGTGAVIRFYLGNGAPTATDGTGVFPTDMVAYAVDKQLVNPGYTGPWSTCATTQSDVALLHLHTRPGVTPLAYATTAPPTSGTCIGVGFGDHLQPDGTTLTFLEKREADMQINQSPTAVDVQVFHNYSDPLGGAVAEGDSGGPLFCGGTIVGVGSCSGGGQAAGGGNSLYARVDLVAPWVASTIATWDWSCYTTTICQLPSGQQIFPTVTSPPNWCSAKGGHLVSKQTCGDF